MAAAESSGRNHKRKRTNLDEGASTATPTFERPVDFWIDDGNVVLQVESTQFRVHQSMLAANSTVFNDMFSLPQAEGTLLAMEGCPLVHCQDDTAQDWKNLLMFIYYPLKFRKTAPGSILPFTTLKSMLRLGKKYQFDLIRDEGLKLLKRQIPTDMFTWNIRMAAVSRDVPLTYSWIKDREFDIISIALELGIYTILPACYYLCAVQVPTRAIFEGIRHEDGTLSRLPPDIQRLIIEGRSWIRQRVLSQTLAWLTSEPASLPCTTCISWEKCSLRRLKTQLLVMKDLAVNLQCALKDFRYYGEGAKFCPSCRYLGEKMHEDGRRDLWRDLPLLFDLPQWREMKDFEE